MWKIRPFAQKSDFLDKYQTKFDQISAKGLIIRPKSDKSDRLGSTAHDLDTHGYTVRHKTYFADIQTVIYHLSMISCLK